MHAPSISASHRQATSNATPSWLARLALPALAALLAYLLASLWPVDFTSETLGHEPQTVRLHWSEIAFEVTADLQLALLAGVAGGLGSLTHVAGQLLAMLHQPGAMTRRLLRWQLLSPLFGIAIALLFHVVMRNAAMPADIGAGRLDVARLAAHGLLAGLLTKPAIDRFAELVAGVVHRLRRMHRAGHPNAQPHQPMPVVHGVDIQSQGSLHTRPTLIVRGARFTAVSHAYVNGRPQETLFVDDTQLLVRMRLGTGWLGPGLRVRVVNPPPGGGMSVPFVRS